MDAGGVASTVVSTVVDSLTLSIENLDERNFNRNHTPTIHPISIDIRKGKETAYTPRSFPIGPYHRHEDIKDINLLYLNGETSGIKILYLKNLLDRNPDDNKLEKYASAIKSREEDARDCYHDRCKGVDSKKFVEMMVLDGCFIIEFFLKCFEGILTEGNDDGLIKQGNLRDLQHDLMLMENQIPFFILKLILDNSQYQVEGVDGNLQILDLALYCLRLVNFYPCEMITKEMLKPIHQEEDGKNIYHLLHLNYLCHMVEIDPEMLPAPETLKDHLVENLKWVFHWIGYGLLFLIKCFLLLFFYALIFLLKFIKLATEVMWQKPNLHNRPKMKAKKEQEKQMMIPTATELNESGVIFKRKKDAKNYMDVSFQNGIMEIPVVFIEDGSDSIFRNFLALEQNCAKVGNKFTSYVLFLDDLIDTTSDVAFLKKSKIIESMLGCDEDVAKFFNGLGVGILIDTQNPYLVKLFQDVHVHWNKDHNRWRAMMMRNYFSSPWSIVSLFGALTLLAFGALQVSYTIKYGRSP